MGRAAARAAPREAARFPDGRRESPQRRAKGVERFGAGGRVRVGASELGAKSGAERSVFALQRARTREKPRDVLAEKDAVLPPVEAPPERTRVVRGAMRARADSGKEVLELRADRAHVAERDAGGREAHELAVGGVAVAVHEADGIGPAAGFEVAPGTNCVERAPYRVTPRVVHSVVVPSGDAARGGSFAARFSAATRAACVRARRARARGSHRSVDPSAIAPDTYAIQCRSASAHPWAASRGSEAPCAATDSPRARYQSRSHSGTKKTSSVLRIASQPVTRRAIWMAPEPMASD